MKIYTKIVDDTRTREAIYGLSDIIEQLKYEIKIYREVLLSLSDCNAERSRVTDNDPIFIADIPCGKCPGCLAKKLLTIYA